MNLYHFNRKFALAGILFVTLSIACFAQQTANMRILKTFPIGSAGGWDYLTVDHSNRKLYVSHSTQVNILDLGTGDSVGVIPNTNGVHGIALVETMGKGYTSNGRDNNCTVFDLKTDKEIGAIAVGTNPDAIFFDDFSNKIFVFNGRSQDASVIDPATDKVIATIPLGGKPETGVSDGEGRVYVNSETTNEVVVINATTYKVEKRYKIEKGNEPSGLAIDRENGLLSVGCGGNQTCVVMNIANGKNLAALPIGSCDGVAFDPGLRIAYTSNGEGNISVIKELSPAKFSLMKPIETEPGARTIAIDTKTHRLYLPTAKLEPAKAGERPKMIPGTFHVIEVGL
ncbi:YncE family protein [Pedobacter sp. HMF7647]|uniref:YncE family protein n=1 Tax=Hufsiella arboris TaxID=2695275 RepID=A0A7K1YCZ1_9SPHI|nr:YncE family protein [Hufsiella arboris]MXV51969.1 YncE family protein [Hufsiella arboris]